jgi:MtN3 and saliva related transmembrane protein
MQAWLPTVLGLVAGCCSTAAFVPQVLKIWREGETRAISLRMYLMRDAGFVLWLAYGIAAWNLALIVPNVVAALVISATMAVAYRYRRPRE